MTKMLDDRLEAFDLGVLDRDPKTQIGYREAKAVQFGGILLLEMREAARLSRKQLAEALGRSEEEIESHERGKSPEGPPMGLILRAAALCGAHLSVSFDDPTKTGHVIRV
jgi:DNA-binding transcriptional regulator YiaG